MKRTPSVTTMRTRVDISFIFQVLLFCVFLLLIGCAPQMKTRFTPQPSPEEMGKAVEQVRRVSVPLRTTTPSSVGSLWPQDNQVFFYRDRKALQVGDSLTIRIVETAEASNGADTNSARKSAINGKLNALLGLQGVLAKSELSNLVDASSSNSHAGTGLTSRQGRLTASITAVVKDVLPNGNLIVQGNRTVLVNHEEQFMTLTGMVRPEDVGRDNVILSTQVADARIAFGGIGVVSDKQRTGWGTWVFDWLFPF
jgi:flagellar L-ring protein FlgH